MTLTEQKGMDGVILITHSKGYDTDWTKKSITMYNVQCTKVTYWAAPLHYT